MSKYTPKFDVHIAVYPFPKLNSALDSVDIPNGNVDFALYQRK